MNDHARRFYAKVMLFGEYCLMVGSKALTIPLRDFSGSFHFFNEYSSEGIHKHLPLDYKASHTSTLGNTTQQQGLSKLDITSAKASRASLMAYLDYLLNQTAKVLSFEEGIPERDRTRSFEKLLDLHAFKEDLANGMYFKSDIPGGSGLGSSGALVAAVYDRYAYEKIDPVTASDFHLLKSILAAMESMFHGTSSGIDPLSCYLNTGLQMGSGKQKTFIMVTRFPSLTGTFFLVDTGIVGNTGPLVHAFLEKMENPDFRHFMSRQYIPTNDACISAILDGDAVSLEKNMLLLSELQIQHFREMIPTEFFDVWKYGLLSGAYSLKLCGSGGGGFLLGYTNDPARLNQLFHKQIWLELLMPH